MLCPPVRRSRWRQGEMGERTHLRPAERARTAGAPQNGFLLLVAEKEQTFYVLLFKMQQCKGHRGRDETRSCNKEGEIKNNDRNKLS